MDLVGADGGGGAHGLAGAEVADEVLVLHHLLDGEGEGDGDGEGEALGDRDDEDGDADDEHAQVLEVVDRVVPSLPRRRPPQKQREPIFDARRKGFELTACQDQSL